MTKSINKVDNFAQLQKEKEKHYREAMRFELKFNFIELAIENLGTEILFLLRDIRLLIR